MDKRVFLLFIFSAPSLRASDTLVYSDTIHFHPNQTYEIDIGRITCDSAGNGVRLLVYFTYQKDDKPMIIRTYTNWICDHPGKSREAVYLEMEKVYRMTLCIVPRLGPINTPMTFALTNDIQLQFRLRGKILYL